MSAPKFKVGQMVICTEPENMGIWEIEDLCYVEDGLTRTEYGDYWQMYHGTTGDPLWFTGWAYKKLGGHWAREPFLRPIDDPDETQETETPEALEVG